MYFKSWELHATDLDGAQGLEKQIFSLSPGVKIESLSEPGATMRSIRVSVSGERLARLVETELQRGSIFSGYSATYAPAAGGNNFSYCLRLTVLRPNADDQVVSESFLMLDSESFYACDVQSPAEAGNP